MEDNIQKLFDTVEDLRQNANVDATFGEPMVVEGRTLIPVAQVGYGFGLSFASGVAADGPDTTDAEIADEGGKGAAGGMQARPLGVIEVTPAGIQVEPVVDEQKLGKATVLLIGWLGFWIAAALIRIFGPRGE